MANKETQLTGSSPPLKPSVSSDQKMFINQLGHRKTLVGVKPGTIASKDHSQTSKINKFSTAVSNNITQQSILNLYSQNNCKISK